MGIRFPEDKIKGSFMLKNKVISAVLVFGLIGSFHQIQADTLSIEDAVAKTLETNPEVQAELREVDARERQVREALGGYLPTVDVLAGFGFQERDPTGRDFSPSDRTRNELERHEAQLNVRQLVFDGFNTPNEHKNQKSRHQSAAHRAHSVGEDIALEVVRTYLDVPKQKAILELADQTLATHQEVYNKMQKRADSGVGSRADLDQISGRLALSRSNVISQTANLLDAKTNFQRVVGRFPETNELVTPGTYGKHLPETVAEAVAKATENHPLLKSASADIEAVSYQYEQTKSGFYPQFHIEIERDLNDNIDGIEEQVDDLKVMLRMRYNLFRGNSDQAKKQQFAYLVEKAKQIRANTYRQVEQEVRLAWVARDAIQNQIPVLENYVIDAQETKNAYVKQFDLGRRTLLDLLNTENEMISARQSLTRANFDLLFNEYRLFHAMGELLNTVGSEI